ncbi:MAG: S-layer homology domain-containing protein [Cyanobacteria bacterium P01_D01_bin.1]
MHFLQRLSAKAFIFSAIAPTLLASPSLAQTFNNPYPIFSDAADHWASACIEGVGNEGLMKGYLDGRFLPDGTMTRAEFAVMMIKAFPNAQTVREAPNFSDVAADFWGSGAIQAAYERGFLAGYPGNVFKPSQPITRAQAIVVMANAQRLMLAENGPEDSQFVLRNFLRDWRQVPDWGSDAIAAAIQRGIVVSYPEASRLRPSDSITRGEATALLCRTNQQGTDARYYVPANYITGFVDPPELRELREFPTEFVSIFFQRTVLNDQMLFAGDNDGVAELWTTNGTVEGTQRVQTLQIEQPDGAVLRATDPIFNRTTDPSGDSGLWIQTEQAFRQAEQSNSLQAGIWHSDGTAAGTVAISSLDDELARSLQNSDYWVIEPNSSTFKGQVPFITKSLGNTQLWLTDGKTEAGTYPLLGMPDVYENDQTVGFGPSNFVAVDDYLLFTASSGEDVTLWRSDGTVEGTAAVKTVTGTAGMFRSVEGLAYFELETPELGQELWTSDGTEAGTTVLKDFFSGPESSAARVLTAVGENVFILANSSAGAGLWVTTGTPESTRLVTQLPDSIHSGDVIFAEHDGRLFFVVAAPASAVAVPELQTSGSGLSFELWVTDGTAAGTVQLGSPIGSYFTDFTSFQGRLFFNGNGPNGQELWVTDATAGGTHQVVDLAPGSSPYSPNCPIQSLPTRQERQAQSSPALACEFYEVANSSSPRSLTVRGDFLYFVAGDRDLYRTDGTALGTQFIQRLRGEDGDYSPGITPLGEQLLVTGYSDNSRPQLWSVLEPVVPVLSGYP